MIQNKSVPAQCLFCANPANSREDLWPLWVLERVNTREKIRRTIGKKASYHTVSRKIRIKSVCTTCNNEWMSKLEEQCIPLIGSLLEDVAFRLDSSTQLLVALWTTKIAMVLDSLKENPKKFYLRTDCEKLKDTRSIPAGTTIWMGRYFGRTLHTGFATFTALDKSVPAADCSTMTIVIGHLILEVTSVRFRHEYRNRVVGFQPNPGRWDQLLIPIWPTVSDAAFWPPPLSFRNSGPLHIGHLLNRWRPR
jgi:hypothetical protein